MVILCSSSFSHAVQYKCDSSVYDSWCTIDGINLSRNDRLVPVADQPSLITEIQLSGTLPVLSREICDTLPNLETIYAYDMSVEQVIRS